MMSQFHSTSNLGRPASASALAGHPAAGAGIALTPYPQERYHLAGESTDLYDVDARARERDPRRQEKLQALQGMLADIFAAPPEFTDLTVAEE
jgi:hypothetical protein